MRTSPLWNVGMFALVMGLAAVVAGTVVGTELGSMLAGYGVLCTLASAYLVVGLAVRGRVRRALARPERSPDAGHLLGRRVF